MTNGRTLYRRVWESSHVRDWRAEWARPYRRPLNWEYDTRFYLYFGTLVFMLPFFGFHLLMTDSWFQRLMGAFLLPVASGLVIGLVHTLRKPVDPEALAEQRRAREVSRMRRRRPPRFPPGSRNSTKLPPSREH